MKLHVLALLIMALPLSAADMAILPFASLHAGKVSVGETFAATLVQDGPLSFSPSLTVLDVGGKFLYDLEARVYFAPAPSFRLPVFCFAGGGVTGVSSLRDATGVVSLGAGASFRHVFSDFTHQWTQHESINFVRLGLIFSF